MIKCFIRLYAPKKTEPRESERITNQIVLREEKKPRADPLSSLMISVV